MPGLYVYAITDAPRRAPVRGLFNRLLRSVGAAGVHAVVEEAARAPKPTVSRLRAQDRVLGAIAARGGAVLPVRFGSFATDARELRRLLEGRAPELRRALRQARGCAQMTVRLALHRSRQPLAGGRASADSQSGARYLRALLEQERARRAHPAFQAVQRAARGLARAERVEWQSGAVEAASIYHLVPRARLQNYLAKIAIVSRRADATLIVSGPFLPFAFGGELREGNAERAETQRRRRRGRSAEAETQRKRR